MQHTRKARTVDQGRGGLQRRQERSYLYWKERPTDEGKRGRERGSSGSLDKEGAIDLNKEGIDRDHGRSVPGLRRERPTRRLVSERAAVALRQERLNLQWEGTFGLISGSH